MAHGHGEGHGHAHAGMEASIENLKTLLATVTDASTQLEHHIAEISGKEEERTKLLEEIDQHLDSFHVMMLEQSKKIDDEFDELKAVRNDDFATDFFEQIQNMTETFQHDVESKVAETHEAHANLQSSHDNYVSTHEDYMQIALQTLEVTSTLHDDATSIFDVFHTGVTQVHEQSHSHFEDLNHILEEAVQHIGESAPQIVIPHIGEVLGSLHGPFHEIIEAAWEAHHDHCHSALQHFHHQAHEAADDLGHTVHEILEELGTHVEKELKSPLEQAFEKAHEQGVASMIHEVSEVLGVMGACTAATAALEVFVPSLSVSDKVLESFERAIEAIADNQ